MLYHLSKAEVAKIRSLGFTAEFTGAEMLFAMYHTDPEAVAKILPKPLKPINEPRVSAFIARYPQTNFGCAYNEGAILIYCKLGNETGVYCVSMPVDDDMTMIYGRENYGYPKKIAEEISLERTETQITGSVRRKGVEILRIELKPKDVIQYGELSRFWNPGTDRNGRPCLDGVSFLYKQFLSPNGKGFDYIPRLVRQNTQFKPRPDVLKGEGNVTVRSSPHDPLGEVPVRSLVSCFYGIWDNTMLPGKVVSRAWNVFGFLPHAFFKTDLGAFALNDDKIS